MNRFARNSFQFIAVRDKITIKARGKTSTPPPPQPQPNCNDTIQICLRLRVFISRNSIAGGDIPDEMLLYIEDGIPEQYFVFLQQTHVIHNVLIRHAFFIDDGRRHLLQSVNRRGKKLHKRQPFIVRTIVSKRTIRIGISITQRFPEPSTHLTPRREIDGTRGRTRRSVLGESQTCPIRWIGLTDRGGFMEGRAQGFLGEIHTFGVFQ
mmetsp:Transcript_30365/g.35024  ORF Transcript_30365/g.35024 Transcript_30365/m.35024 type:complete len:208 (+) Transcript_30365:131-754(+)